jgi:hypothetical protein
MKKLIFAFAFLFSAAAVCQTPQYLPKSRVPWTDPQDYGGNLQAACNAAINAGGSGRLCTSLNPARCLDKIINRG